MSIYSQLLKYQSRENRSNDENYLTEILCDYLNRLSAEDSKEFVKTIVFYGQEITNYNEFVLQNNYDSEKELITWKTQFSIAIDQTTKFPDLVGFIRNLPVIIIEVKIGAGFTYRIHNDNDGNEVSTPQLIDYGKWLNEQNPHGVLLLLSYSTTPPINFLINNNIYGIQQKNYVTWQHIYNWLKQIEQSIESICLTKDFINFLLERNMANASPNSTDLSALNIFMSGSGNRIQSMMKSVRETLEEKYIDNMKWGKEKTYLMDGTYTFAFEQNLAWSWSFVECNEYTYLAWGICFPDEHDEWEWKLSFPELPKNPFVFIGIFSSGEKTKQICLAKTKNQPKEWMWCNIQNFKGDGLLGIKTFGLDNILSFDKDTTTELYNFVDGGFCDLQPLVDEIIKI